jgi:hypothetical protein
MPAAATAVTISPRVHCRCTAPRPLVSPPIQIGHPDQGSLPRIDQIGARTGQRCFWDAASQATLFACVAGSTPAQRELSPVTSDALHADVGQGSTTINAQMPRLTTL